MTLVFTPQGPGEVTAHLADESATLELGGKLAGVLAQRRKIYLSGDLGAGKTTLVRGMLRQLGYRGRVKSPTYNLVELYKLSSLHLYHFDFYRFRDPREWVDAGFREEFGGAGVCVVEWPEHAAGYLPEPDLDIRLEHADAGRNVRVRAKTDEGRQCLENLIS